MTGASRSLAIVATTASLKTVAEFVRNGAVEASLTEARTDELDLLVEEAFMNVCRHAYPDNINGNATVTYSVPAPGELSIEVADQGLEFNPLMAEAPDVTLSLEHRTPGGLGIFLIKTLARSLTYRRESGWNRLSFSISAAS